MKKILLAVFCAALVSGCSSTPEETPVAAPVSSSPAPAGLLALKGTGRQPEGTPIYNAERELIGTIKKYDDKHEFEEGKVEPGVLLTNAAGAEEWHPESIVEASFLLRQ